MSELYEKDPVIRTTGKTRSKEVERETEDEGEKLPAFEEEGNIAKKLDGSAKGRNWVKDFLERTVERKDNCVEGSRQFREKTAANWAIFAGDLPPKQPPFEHCANPNVPLLLEVLTRVSARSVDELFGDWTNVFGVQRLGDMTPDTAEVLNKHGNWQIRVEIPDFRRQLGHRGMLHFYTVGDTTHRSSRDQERNINRHELKTPDEFFTPYSMVTTMPDYSDLPYHFLKTPMYRNQLQAEKSWVGVKKVLKTEADWDLGESPHLESKSESDGIEIPSGDKNAPYMVWSYEGWEDLPGQDRDRWVKAEFIQELSGEPHLFSLNIHEEEDWRDKVRFEDQLKELEQYRQQSEMFAQAKMQEEQMVGTLEAALASGQVTDPMQLEETEQRLQMIAQTAPQQPLEPSWLKEGQTEPDPIRMTPIRLYVHGVCIEPIVGNLGMAPGRIVADLNRAANVALGQYTDQASLGNSWSIITTDGVDFDGDFSIYPGKVNKMSGVAGVDLSTAMKELKPSGGNQQLVDLVLLCKDWGQSAIHSSDVMSGEAGKSGETWRGVSARIEQATKLLSSTVRKYADEVLINVLRNNAKLNAIFMDDTQVVNVNSDRIDLDPEELRVGRDLYDRDYRVEIVSDLRFATQSQKVAEADEVLRLPEVAPQLMGNKAFMYAATVDALKARGKYQLIQTLGPPPQPGMGPLGSDLPPPLPGEEEMLPPPGDLPPEGM